MNAFFCFIFFSLSSAHHAVSTETLSTCTTSLSSTGEAKSAATFVGEDGLIYISKEAHVFGGQAVDTDKFRPAVIQSEIGKAGEENSSVKISNFLHNNRFNDAEVQLSSDAIEKVYVQTNPFPIVPGVIAGHVQARFVFKNGQEIEIQSPDDPTHTIKIKDLIVSYEAALPKGASYNFALGTVDAKPLVGRIASGAQKHSEGPNRETLQYELPISGGEAAQLLSYYIQDSAQIGMSFFYNTINRNCTTAIFDGIDTLAGVKAKVLRGEVQPFLTVIGGDPVVGPTVNALLKRFPRGLVQVQDMRDEYKGQYYSLGVPAAVAPAGIPFAPEGDDPMTLLILTEGTEHLSQEDRARVQSVVDEIKRDLPSTVNTLLATAFSTLEDMTLSPQIIGALTEGISNRLRERLQQIRGAGINHPISLQIHLSPFPALNGHTTDLRSTGARAELPFPMQQIDLNFRNKLYVLKLLESSLALADNHAPEDLPAYLKAFVLRAHLDQNFSDVQTQILLGANHFRHEGLDISNDQVELVELRTPEEPFSVLLTHDQNLDEANNPIARIRFGADVRVLTGNQEAGALFIPEPSHNRFLCWGPGPHGPQLVGTTSPAPLGDSRVGRLGGNFFAGNQSLTMNITDLEMNLRTLELLSTRVRLGITIGLWQLRCLEINSVNEQFGSEANAEIQKLIQRLGPALHLF